MKNRILLAALLALGFAGCAGPHGVLTQAKVHQIRPGATTEVDLNTLFGPPDTRWAALYGRKTQLDWFRSVPPGAGAYVPVFGQFLGGLDFHIQQLTVVLGPSGRVQSYQIYNSNGEVRSENLPHPTTVETAYHK